MDKGNLSKGILAEVSTAFELLLGAIQAVINDCTQAIVDASKRGDYQAVRRFTDRAESITKFRAEVVAIRKKWKWNDLEPVIRPYKKTLLNEGNVKPSGRSRPGVLTPERNYYVPILESIVELGGSATVKQVLEKVLEKMQDVLKPDEFTHVPSGHELRWRNRARYVRANMVNEGLLKSKSDSRRGFWEITEQGRVRLNHERGQ